MAGSVNKVILIGNLGADPEIRSMQSGDEVCNLSIATSESWKDKASGEKKEKTEWHRVVVFNQNIVSLCKNYLKKGAKVYIEGQLETRSWDDKESGQKKYTTEVVVKNFRGDLTMLDTRTGAGGGMSNGPQDNYQSSSGGNFGGGSQQRQSAPVDEFEDEIPF